MTSADTGIVTLKIASLKAFKFGKSKKCWEGRRHLTFEVHVSMGLPNGSSIDCDGFVSTNSRWKAVFFSGDITADNVIIKSQDTFRIVDYSVVKNLRKYRITDKFCEQAYPDVFHQC